MRAAQSLISILCLSSYALGRSYSRNGSLYWAAVRVSFSPLLPQFRILDAFFQRVNRLDNIAIRHDTVEIGSPLTAQLFHDLLSQIVECFRAILRSGRKTCRKVLGRAFLQCLLYRRIENVYEALRAGTGCLSNGRGRRG